MTRCERSPTVLLLQLLFFLVVLNPGSVGVFGVTYAHESYTGNLHKYPEHVSWFLAHVFGINVIDTNVTQYCIALYYIVTFHLVLVLFVSLHQKYGIPYLLTFCILKHSLHLDVT